MKPWVIAANSTDEVIEQVNTLLVKHHLDSKYVISNVERLHPRVTDYEVTFALQV
jgi:hypothetical protein